MTTTNKGKQMGIYIHIPFCVKKCGYCDFLSFESEAAVIHKVYVKALIREIETHGKSCSDYTVDSVFIGGGTPTIILPSMISQIMEAVKGSFNVDANAEITIEGNPKTLTYEKLESYLTAGINRISIGAQSFNDLVLKILSRAHLAGDITFSFNMAREAGFKNINLDLIFGIPRQAFEVWDETLDKVIDLSPEHVSFYSLQIEKGTKFYDMFVKGPYEKISDEVDRRMYHSALKKLAGAGYGHYEISNGAKCGFECRHNVKYWTMADYIGAGLGAHSYVGGVRSSNIKDFDKYIEASLGGGESADFSVLRETCHRNSALDDVSEYMFTGLRMVRGVDLADFEARFGKPVREMYKKEWGRIEKYAKDGFLVMDGGRLRLSPEGMDISNKIMSEFVLTGEKSGK